MNVEVITTEIYQVLVTELGWPAFENQTVSKLDTVCSCTWQPVDVKFLWSRNTGTNWEATDRLMRCRQVLADGTLGRNSKIFDFSRSPRSIPTIEEPAAFAELEKQHHPDKFDFGPSDEPRRDWPTPDIEIC